MAYTGFGTAWFDFDNDGRLDLLAANGAVQAQHQRFGMGARDVSAPAGEPLPLHQPNQLFRNRGNGRFVEVTGRAGAVFGLSEVSRGAAFGDVDNDGDLDVLVTNNNGRARLLINEVGQRNRWIGLRLVGGAGRRDMLGARVGVFRAAGPPLWRRARGRRQLCLGQRPESAGGSGPGSLGAARPCRLAGRPGGRLDGPAGGPWLTLEEGSGQSRE